MPKPATGVYLRPKESNFYQFKIRVPKDLCHLYPSEWAQRGSLGTTSLAEANIKGAQLYANWLATFAQQRQQAEPHSGPNLVKEITPEMSQLIAGNLLHDVLAVDEDIRTNAKKHALGGGMSAVLRGMPEYLSDELAEVNQQQDAAMAEALSKSQRVVALPAMQSTAERLGLAIDQQTSGFAEMLLVCFPPRQNSCRADKTQQ